MASLARAMHLPASGSTPLPAGAQARSRAQAQVLLSSRLGTKTVSRRALRNRHPSARLARASAAEKSEASTVPADEAPGSVSDSELPEALSKEVAKVVKKTATTFAPRASTKTRNPAVPGSALYTIFEVQAYLSMVLGGLLSFNLIFPSDEPDLWRLMGMWSVWMFSIPSLRARDCSEAEKGALNYLFLAVPLLNVTIPLVWKSFAAVWTADVVTFFIFYAWKLEWLKGSACDSE